MLGAALTAIIGTIAKGKAAKAIAGGAAGAIVGAAGPLGNMLYDGFVEGIGPSIEQVGVLIGATLGGWILTRATVWFAPANEPDPKK